MFHYEIVSKIHGSILIDGWATKHWARFQLHDDPDLVAEANISFGALPWPDRIIILPMREQSSMTRKTKPSEEGAFDPAKNNFEQYQERTLGAFIQVQELLRDRVQFITLDFCTPESVRNALPCSA